MIRFEVTGATPEEFAENAMKAWALLAIGLQRAINAAIPAIADGLSTLPTSPASTTSSPPLQAQTNGSESSSTALKEPAPTLVADRADDLWQPEKTGNTEVKPAISKSSKSAKGPKLDDLKTRLSEVIVAATERWGQKRANAYARKLLKEVCAEKIGDIKPEEYADFMDLSEGYLRGTCSETA